VQLLVLLRMLLRSTGDMIVFMVYLLDSGSAYISFCRHCSTAVMGDEDPIDIASGIADDVNHMTRTEFRSAMRRRFPPAGSTSAQRKQVEAAREEFLKAGWGEVLDEAQNSPDTIYNIQHLVNQYAMPIADALAVFCEQEPLGKKDAELAVYEQICMGLLRLTSDKSVLKTAYVQSACLSAKETVQECIRKQAAKLFTDKVGHSQTATLPVGKLCPLFAGMRC